MSQIGDRRTVTLHPESGLKNVLEQHKAEITPHRSRFKEKQLHEIQLFHYSSAGTQDFFLFFNFDDYRKCHLDNLDSMVNNNTIIYNTYRDIYHNV